MIFKLTLLSFVFKFCYMPRRCRIEYSGAIYHVINRGNYLMRVFATEGSKKSFELTLFQCCERYNWILYAYCILDNHFHLAVETREPNLSTGMQWLQSTFAKRYNNFRRKRGHLFQGRYKALIVEQGEHFGSLLHYIHLNSVRSGLCDTSGLIEYRWHSLWYLFRRRRRPEYLDMSKCLGYAGNLADTREGRKRYLSYLDWVNENNSVRKKMKFEQMCYGWALGTKEFKKELVQDFSDNVEGDWVCGEEYSEIKDLYWDKLLQNCMNKLGKSPSDIKSDIKSALWKVMIAYYLKTRHGASNRWLSENLDMGTPAYVSQNISEFEKSKGFKKKMYKNMIEKSKT